MLLQPMNADFPKSIQQVRFEQPVWGLLIRNGCNSLIIDCRNEETQEIVLFAVALDSLAKSKLTLPVTWWERLLGADKDNLFLIHYQDQANPSNVTFKSIGFNSKRETKLEQAPELVFDTISPNLYELESEHHRTVSQFLSIDLVLPCEYLEINNYIILSYYLRSGSGFDRFLLVMKDGSKHWKVKQDSNMKGFADGAFFVADNKLIFIRERNEVCIYSF